MQARYQIFIISNKERPQPSFRQKPNTVFTSEKEFLSALSMINYLPSGPPRVAYKITCRDEKELNQQLDVLYRGKPLMLRDENTEYALVSLSNSDYPQFQPLKLREQPYYPKNQQHPYRPAYQPEQQQYPYSSTHQTPQPSSYADKTKQAYPEVPAAYRKERLIETYAQPKPSDTPPTTQPISIDDAMRNPTQAIDYLKQTKLQTSANEIATLISTHAHVVGFASEVNKVFAMCGYKLYQLAQYSPEVAIQLLRHDNIVDLLNPLELVEIHRQHGSNKSYETAFEGMYYGASDALSKKASTQSIWDSLYYNPQYYQYLEEVKKFYTQDSTILSFRAIERIHTNRQRQQETPVDLLNGQSPYDVLGVKPDATPEEIKAAYRKKSLFLHPDKEASVQGNRMKDVNNAYEILKDEKKRAAYDAQFPKNNAPTYKP